MKLRMVRVLTALLLALALTACQVAPEPGVSSVPPAPTQSGVSDASTPPDLSAVPPEPLAPQEPKDIWLYGEWHGDENVLKEELRLWEEAYSRGVRHMLVEYGYFTAEYLNLWMAAEDDAILEQLFKDWNGTQAHNENVKAFYQRLKEDFPETVFHGTDVGHQYRTTGKRYLLYLSQNGMGDTEEYRLTQESIDQGEKYYSDGSVAYREAMMTENFIRTLESLDGEEIVGFYGAGHIGTEPFMYDGLSVHDSMAKRLLEQYGDRLHLTSLEYALVPDLEPERMDTIQVGDKVYEASYFGRVDISAWSDRYVCREFWRLEDAYDDFKDAPMTGDALPYNNYPTRVSVGQVYVIDYTAADGTVTRLYYRASGTTWQGMMTTIGFTPE